jgi:hypothetical protein
VTRRLPVELTNDVGDPIHLLVSHFREYREAEARRRDVLGDRKAARLEAQAVIGALQMQRRRVVEASSDPSRCEELAKSIANLCADDEQVVGVIAITGVRREHEIANTA